MNDEVKIYKDIRKKFNLFKEERKLIKRIERIKRRQKMIDLFGGYCEECGYISQGIRNIDCFTFHHKDPKQKEFCLGENWLRNWDELLEEAKKCQLLCLTCYTEIHAHRKEDALNKAKRKFKHKFQKEEIRSYEDMKAGLVDPSKEDRVILASKNDKQKKKKAEV